METNQQYISNPMLVGKSKEECIFCLGDEEPPPLKKNDKCDCQYFYHSTCQQSWERQLQQEGKAVQCVMCRKELQAAPAQEQHKYITVIELIRIESIPSRRCKIIIYVISTLIAIVFLLFAYRVFF